MRPTVETFQRQDLPRQRSAGYDQHRPSRALRRGEALVAERAIIDLHDPSHSRGRPRGKAPALVLAVALALPAAAEDLPPTDYGRQLLTETYALIGPEVGDPAMRFAGNNLACANCHMDAGTRSHGLALVGVAAKYPAPLPGGGTESLAERVNGCMTRSMNGRPLPGYGPEMRAILAYLASLTAKADSYGDPVEDPPALPAPATAPDAASGARRYALLCAACHGDDGAGRRNGPPGDALGYLHPPLWGPDSFNAAAGMHRVATAAAFIHANMPLGATATAPVLSVDAAWDIAAFIEAQPRPPAPAEDRGGR
jgi:thiosulfate dehydrogenase